MTHYASGILPLIVVAATVLLGGCGSRQKDTRPPLDFARYQPTAAPLPSATAVKWYPAADWKDSPDPFASPDAKKGGLLRFYGSQPPKSFNYYVDNNTYTHMMFSLMYETLISTDTATLEFVPGLARRWSVSEDGTEFTFVLDARAKWSDGHPVTAADVVWTYDMIMDERSDAGVFKMVYGKFTRPEILDERTVRFRKSPDYPTKDWRDLGNCGEFYVMPMHAFVKEGRPFDGSDFNKIDLVGAPVSGPYRIARSQEQVETEYARVTNWWRKDFLSCQHVCNFDRLLMRYFVDNENGFEALKKQQIDLYPVYSARIMSNETHGEKFDKNWILKRRVRNHEPVGYQGFAMNMRRWPFDDVKVRIAMSKLIDREKMNRTMMFDEYFLLRSYFHDLYDAAHPCKNPLYLYDYDGAEKLLAEAGFVRDEKTGKLMKDGRPFKFTFLSRSPGETKFLSLFNENLERLGIEMNIDTKDFAGWMRDMGSFNFDMTWSSMSASIFRAPEFLWHSREADREQSNNLVGFKNARVDELIAAEKSMESMTERNAVYREIDSLIAAECPYALLWQIDVTRLLYWNRFGMPASILSKYDNESGALTYWWYDEDRDRELGAAMANHSFLPNVPLCVDFDEATK